MKLFSWLNANLERGLIALLLAGMVLLISVNVFMRYIMNASLSWGEELTLWIFVWFIWLSVSYAFYRRDHVRITIVKDLLGERLGLYLDILVDLAVLIFFIILADQCIELIRAPFVMSQKSVVLGLPIPILYSSAPVGAVLSSFRIVQHMLRTIRELKAAPGKEA
ncbi:TRAP transporter small permease [uncultured Cohaesibacter sp.]|uniref:TRAP transporter small permease n=1 Tax=uncultured Cohaesibacter sp. TaxID=1002546 RepID=UPI0029C6F12D|nr:TRAP transporter small permease [uncultured Cohaesibacter sp.]